jgi:hypothetical protein
MVDSSDSSARKITSKAIYASIISKGEGVSSIDNDQDHAVKQETLETNQDLASRIESA